ncbi:myosin heavy chain, cardiac muscle isoform-like [Notolabrus celidotus]|uniref:myosin heavy chain, cardiac muscle isoform-like n=1 Tax=Notolabrus celidotus TaxID=1203425 RepID=UPI00148FFCA1|nr:myosin heavy chain, cardiac muscle isoform-like [Notolabrus celidotus]XP_034538129.1 myosin heavy chain, cardiac muscle isoform-like [Notolabrus celidotus]
MANSKSTSWYQPMDIDESNETLEEIISRYCRWPSQDKPHPQSNQRRLPQRQERYPAAKSQVQELQERLEEERQQRLQCEKENRCLKELKHLKPSFQPQNLTYYVQHTTGKFTGIIKDLNQKLTAKEEANESLKKEVEDLKKWLAEARSSHTELSSKLISQNEDSDRLKKEVDQLTKDKEHQTWWIDRLMNELDEVRGQLWELEALDLKEQVDKLTKEKASLTRWSDRLMKELDEVSDPLWELEALDTKEEVEDLKKRLAEAKTSHTELSSKLKSQKDDSDRLREEVDQLTKEKETQTLWSDLLLKELEEVREQLWVMKLPNHQAVKEETDLAQLMKNLSLQDNSGPSLPSNETWVKELIKISPWRTPP